jgi:PKD repeat protein
VVLGSAGNDNVGSARYPGWYTGVICVAATQDEDLKSDFSNYGNGVDISAPGGNISPWLGMVSSVCNTTNLGHYDRYQGTSMSTPFAAGLAGLILSLNPELDPDEVEEIMEDNADNIDDLNPSYAGLLGAGRINAYKSVLNTSYQPAVDFTTPIRLITPGTTIDYEDLSMGLPDLWDWELEGGEPYSPSDPNPSVTYNEEGSFDAYLYVENEWGYDYITREDYIIVDATPVPWVVFEADTNYACALTDMVSFTDQSVYDPTSWLWEFEPNTVTFMEGTSETSQNPMVMFDDPGFYHVTLTATNANGDGVLTMENMLEVEGIEINFEEDFEDEESNGLILSSSLESRVRIDERAAHPDSEFGLHFDGGAPGSWSGGPTNTTPEEAWEENTDFHGFAQNCNVDAIGVEGVTLTMDMRQTFSVGNTYSWFRVLINGEPVPDVYGVVNFNPETNEDPWTTLTFDLSEYGNSAFDITLQTATYLQDGFSGTEGDNVFIDNIMISNTTSVGDQESTGPGVITYPNPARDRLNYSVNIESNYTVTLMDVNGKMVYSEEISGNESQTGTIDVSSYTPGIYLLNITAGDTSVNKKVIIE